MGLMHISNARKALYHKTGKITLFLEGNVVSLECTDRGFNAYDPNLDEPMFVFLADPEANHTFVCSLGSFVAINGEGFDASGRFINDFSG